MHMLIPVELTYTRLRIAYKRWYEPLHSIVLIYSNQSPIAQTRPQSGWCGEAIVLWLKQVVILICLRDYASQSTEGQPRLGWHLSKYQGIISWRPEKRHYRQPAGRSSRTFHIEGFYLSNTAKKGSDFHGNEMCWLGYTSDKTCCQRYETLIDMIPLHDTVTGFHGVLMWVHYPVQRGKQTLHY